MHPLAGIYCAAVTPLKPDFTPDLEAIPVLLDFLAKRGCHGVLMLGTTGEGPSFSLQERQDILTAALNIRQDHPSLKVLAGTGTPSLSETILITKTAFDLGVDGVVVLPPYYYRRATDEGLFNYFRELIRNGMPQDGCLLGYHIPGLTGIGFTPGLLKRLKDAFPQQFAGIKDSSHDADHARLLGKTFGADLLVLNGTDSFLQLALENRAGGCITAPANLYSPALRQVWDAFHSGDNPSNLQERIAGLRHILDAHPPFPPLLKALLENQHGFPRWPVRPPLEDTPPAILEIVLNELATVSG